MSGANWNTGDIDPEWARVRVRMFRKWLDEDSHHILAIPLLAPAAIRAGMDESTVQSLVGEADLKLRALELAD